MNIVELYSGSSNFSKEMRKRGHNVIDIDIDPKTPAKKHLDIANLTFKDLENMFEDHKVDFIFAAPDTLAYLGLFKSRESLLFNNILAKANCGYIVELTAYPPRKSYRQQSEIIDLDYTKFIDVSNRISHLATNCHNLKQFLNDKLLLLEKITDRPYFTKFKNGTPHQLIILLADFIETYNN